ncbi:XPG N-terminal domain-containing protein [Obelidium mucronatum]|nr:XPG N-terminal domain-containing protein [Obelidium mucronatum]
MGVKGLWSLLEQSSETVTLEQLSGKRVAVDASIWLFQFLKALRDGEGNAVAGAHVKGFFVRICKLMFYGIRPVFVFDGATPPLKRVTVRRRRERKADASSSVQQTAEKLLQQQLRLHAIRNLDQNAENSGGQKRKASTGPSLIPEDPDVIPTTQTQPQKKPKHLSSSDAYLLPPQVHPLQTSSSTDQRLLDPNDLSHFIAQHLPSLATTVEDDSLASLSQDLQYQIILNLKVKSREASASRVAELLEAQRREGVGAFSQMQIDGLVRRNALTEKLYSVAKGEAAVTEGLGRRMAGVRGKEYVLVKDETVGAGYTMRPLAGKLSKPESDGVKIEIANEKQPKSAVDLGVYLRSAHSEPVSFREIAGDACIDISADDDQDGGSIFRTAGGIDIEVPAELLDANQPLFSDDEHEYENITTMKPSKFTSSATILDSQSDDDGELFIEIPVSPEKALHDEVIVIDDDDHVPPGDQPLFSDSDESDVFIRNSRKRAQPTKTVISSPPLSPRPRLRSLKQPPRKKPKTVPTLEEVVEEWEDLGVADSKLEPMVGDDVSVDDIMKMFADKEKKNARESSPAKTSKNAPASGKPIIPLAAATAVAAVSDELSPNEIMLLFQKNEEKSPTASTKTSGLDVLARSASGAVPDDVSPSEVMKMFAQATPTESAQTPAGEAATEALAQYHNACTTYTLQNRNFCVRPYNSE